MDSNGGFHEVEKDGKLFLVYHHPKYCSIPQIQTLTSSHDLLLQPLFLCPKIRCRKNVVHFSATFPLNSSPEYIFPTTTDSNDHHVMPLFWCNNKEFDVSGGCYRCHGSNFGTDYYFCEYCDQNFHKECVQSPLKIKHPYHPKHSLQLSFHHPQARTSECLCCGKRAKYMVYHCTICQAFMHPTCAMKPIPFVIDPPKKHVHPLTFFPRQTSLTCNVCGLLRKIHPTYVCLRCNFAVHIDCMSFPNFIKISRHKHRVSYIPSAPSREWFCGICRQSVNRDYGAYTCDKCSDYVVHPICATGKNVWDGKELEGVPEEGDLTQDLGPFNVISKGVILYFLHGHHLWLEVSLIYDENKVCQACVLPIYEGNFYVCMECEFILHEKCAQAPRRIQHALHPHPLTLKESNEHSICYFTCNACDCKCGGFVYECRTEGCTFNLDVRCASIVEPFDYKGHEDPLFLALDQEVKLICQVCKRTCEKQLNCIKCNYVVCFKCATLPYKARYKHDTHFLTVSCGEEVSEKDWCEVCERNLKDTRTKVFYWCNECFTTFHIECVFGEDPYMKLGQYFDYWGKIQILGKCKISRPLCDSCKKRCHGKIFKRGNSIACSLECMVPNLY
ncbi:PREDICTED: uncharacterized protein LOC104782472 [Camelina sativa]|uniref:Uncharacterized protein LOC104782472 n=1 Tax=Camelina sativa TaxID=90675 RepID=A0ABM0YTP0_CAMSA|nr:PREDICTED: uncharacterized protein LOC104782472 [Camelina sativa]